MLDFNILGAADNVAPADHASAFREAMRNNGISPPALLIPDGKIHRFTQEGDKPKSDNGWYVFFESGRYAGGAYGTWKDQDKSNKWASHNESVMSDAERAAYKKATEAMAEARRIELERLQKDCATKCTAIWDNSAKADQDHPYLVKKGVRPNGAKIYNGCLALPITSFDGVITGMQFIAPDGSKKFKTGSKKSGGFFFIGKGQSETVVLCEGFATGATIHEATGLDVMVCFDCGNMVEVARKLKGQSDKRFVVAGDNDYATNGNPGLKHATDAAGILDARLVIPKAIQGTDFNDMATERGIESVREAICPSVNTTRYKLLTRDDIKSFQPLKWIVKGILPSRGMAQMYGASRAGKSFLSFDMGCAIAEGRNWFGYRVKQTPVVYVMLEGEAGLKQRMEAWEAHNSRQIPDLFQAVTQPWGITEDIDVNDLAAVIPKGSVVIVDTQNRAAPTVNENSSEDMGKIIEGAKTLERLIEGVVMLVAHTGKDTTKGVRGHSSQIAAVDAAIEVSRNGDARSWMADKVKDGVDGKTHAFRLKIVELGIDDDGDIISSCIIDENCDGLDAPLTDFGGMLLHAIIKSSADSGITSSDGLMGALVGDCKNLFSEMRKAKDQSASRQAIAKAFGRAMDELVEKCLVVMKNNLVIPINPSNQNDIMTYKMMPK